MTEKKKEKKKLVKVEGFNSGAYRQKPRSIAFSLVSNPADGRKQVMCFQTCRDYLSDALHAHIHNGGNGVYKPGKNPSIDTDKLRLLIGRHFDNDKARDKFVENIFSAKRLLNFYEDVAGWNRSKITTVNHSDLKYDAWLITGPKEWVQYTNLLSIITLIFRIIGNYGPIEFSNNEDVEKWFYKLVEQYSRDQAKSSVFQYDGDLSSYLPVCWDKFYMIMKHHKEIFTLPMEKIFPADTGVHGVGGVVSLCKFSTGSKILDKNMKELYARFKREKYRTMKSDGKFFRLKEEFSTQKKLEDEENRIKAGVNSIW
jgi:hypothetical protein